MAVEITKDKIIKKYHPYMNRNERYQVFWGGAGSGKSRFVAQKLTKELIVNKITLLVLMQTYTGMEQKVFQEFLTVFEQFGIKAPLVKVKRSPLQIDFANGSKILFMGADDRDKLKSLSGIDYCWVEEADNIEYKYWVEVQLRLRGKGIKKKFFISFNPTSEDSWLKSEFFDNPLDDSFTCHSTYLDNEFLDEGYVKNFEQIKDRSPDDYRVYALGEWGTLGKTIFEKGRHWRVEDFDYEDVAHHKMIVGMDFGFTNDPTSLVQSFVDEENKLIYVQDGFYQRGMLSSDIHSKLEQMQLLKAEILADSASPMTIAELKKLGVRRIRGAKKGAGSILAGIDTLKTYTIIVHPSLDWLENELKNYQYKEDKKTGKYINEPLDKYNHAIDALRYSIQLIGSDNRLKLMSKSSFGF